MHNQESQRLRDEIRRLEREQEQLLAQRAHDRTWGIPSDPEKIDRLVGLTGLGRAALRRRDEERPR